jgi:WD40 repeat protein
MVVTLNRTRFSTVDFHSATQKLAVGTHEGALIMYDLKTASRLYILEPHRHPVSAVNFSPDGRRLMTVSLEEGCLTVWKIGSSLSGFFNVGGPPRQGGKPGEPFKRIEFARADNGEWSACRCQVPGCIG